MAEKLYDRAVLKQILPFLKTKEIIVLHGARQVGKTYIMRILQNILNQRGESTHFIDLEDSRFVRILDKGVVEFIKYIKEEGLYRDNHKSSRKKLYIFIDEIQYLANPSSFLKLLADHHSELKIIVSGSSSFAIKSKFKDSLVGRTVNFIIYNLSFAEFLFFKEVRFDDKTKLTDKKIEELKKLFEEYVLYGGYPRAVLAGEAVIKEKYIQQIIDTYVKKDIRDLAGVRDVEKFNRLLEVLASQSGSLLNITELANTLGLAKRTIMDYLFLLEQTYIIKLVRPYSRNLRSEIFKTPKVFFYDTGLMQMLWLKEIPKEILGQTFETAIFSELAKQSGAENINYWRTVDKKEIDFIVRRKNTIRPLEIKLNFSQFKDTAVRFFANKYDNALPYSVVGLRGKKVNGGCYPWEL